MAWTFFSLQMAFESPPDDPWRRFLRNAVVSGQPRQDAEEKRQFYSEFVRVVLPELGRVRRVAWDLLRTDSAKADFDAWVTDLEDSSDVEPPDPHAAPGEARHQVITVLVLAKRGGNADLALGEACDLPEHRWLQAATVGRLLSALPSLSYTSVHADAVYLQPGRGLPGMTAQELDEGWVDMALIDG